VTSAARETTYLRGLGLSQVDLARATGPGDEERLAALAAVVKRLEQVIGRAHVAEWLRTSIPALRWAAPLDLIGTGDRGLVDRVIDGLEEAGTTI
jgi:hypothetical protein